MIQTLSDLQPIILFSMLILMYSLESFRPYLAKPAQKKQHDIQNFILTFISIVMNIIVGLAVVSVVEYVGSHQLGLLNMVTLPEVVELIAGILLLDLCSYGFHNMQHRIPLLWRFHRVHHSDLALNTSSSLRFHPVEVVLNQGLMFMVATLITGASMGSFIIYGTIALPLIIMQHSNIKFPNWIENYGRLIFATPGWHKIHHSDEQKFTDSHYGDVFTFWDRIFGTWHKINPEQIHYGLKNFTEQEKQKAVFLLKSPFIEINASKNSSEN